MTKITLQQEWKYDGLKTIELENLMAPMVIEASDGDSVILEGELSLKKQEEDFELKDYMESDFQDGVLKLDFDEIGILEPKIKSSQIRLKVPAGVLLKIEIENMPLGLSGLKNDLHIESENAPVSVRNCDGTKHLESENGPLRIHNSTGNLFAALENGPISAEDISGENLHVESENGPIKVRLASYTKVDVESENGPIYYETQPVEGGDFKFKTENGIVHLVLPLAFCFSLKAESERGNLKSKLDAEVIKEDQNFKIEHIYDGEEITKISIETENGLIKLSSDGHINLDFIKNGFNQLKEAFQNAKTSEEKDKVVEMANKVIASLQKAAGSINEEIIKEKVNSAIAMLKELSENFDLGETKTMVQGKLEDLGAEIYDGVQSGLKNVKAEFDELKYEHLNTDSIKDYVMKVVNSPLIKPYLSAEKKKLDKEEISERSRLKILDMLESGKITSEEAEKLLRAIGKE
ncbi:MAG: DUF4097 family beta strand repeat-containing protein [Candidatus Cloacimonetes bacterium]|jgi:DUF4097 and DUF4098 domain-containing protein YvlB|nr:DUF4097 family beta strand repeat-containing protein [Candidatus Cloacimonadota bacterium]MCB5286355.1 DUF4097 family beta strand repeat-containing protein [Candidatus Cloacimonadota bacterium]MCK9184044.1 DUF4097 family beta strand repeat-containing protein [Candidatus Cloacimonadota bacterium]MCK9583753.1 DUF4097 family beta strand repeat-containing protein [Candidatus Cloacimonadota bacterium]MDY0228677.1 DUF4097 family beta strand repeat-containing protein [Candidatus Cloacimonadaceae ba